MNQVPITREGDPFLPIPASTRFAILLPTGRWSPVARAIIGSLVGVANEEIAVLIADNCENDDKREFLRKIRSINPYILAVSHEKNIGSAKNFFYLFDWCRKVEYCAVMADDDWMSPTYHPDSYRTLLENPQAAGASTGTTQVNLGDGKLVNVDQPSMRGATPFERMRQWDGIAARATMYNASRREALQAAVGYLSDMPVNGLTLAEDLWELNRLSLGDFLTTPGEASFVHYPAAGSRVGDATQRFYDILCKDAGLQYPFVFFTAASTAVQTAVFLMGNRSPIADPQQRELCGQYAFGHIFSRSFLPKVSGVPAQQALREVFASHPKALDGALRYCTPEFGANPHFDQGVVEWLIEVVKVFESKPEGDDLPLSEKFRRFLAGIYP